MTVRMTLYDISRPMCAGLPVWPGDEPFQYTANARISDGATVNLGSISLSVHSGTHVDAPIHFRESGQTIGHLDLAPFIGPALVIDVRGIPVIRAADIHQFLGDSERRVLLRTGAWPDPAVFPTDFPVIAADVPPLLGNRGVMLLGVDVPSVDLFHSRDLPNHHSLDRNGIRILESLNLGGIPAGRYALAALPLSLEEADGSPVRAILRTLAASPPA